jgi:single-stranded-DNA-specific exonuclease
VPESFAHFIGGHRLIGELLVRRGLTEFAEAQAFLRADRYTPTPAEAIPDLEAAAARIERAILNHEKILIWGDFDVDGQTSTTLLVQTLRALGADPLYRIPIRADESHGINLDKLEPYLDQGLQLILTCDTGIGEHEALNEAEARGIDVIITDHHVLPDRLPAAYAIVNPQMLPEDHPLRTLPGVGVAYKLAEALFFRAGTPEKSKDLLDLVALGIVADVAEQVGDTRYLLQHGLDQLRDTRRQGLRKLYEVAEINSMNLNSQDIAFGLSPRLNALGRLGDANEIVEFLLNDDAEAAAVMARRLDGLNAERKLLTEQIYQACLAIIEQSPELLRNEVIVLAQKGWAGGVLGIVASRLVEEFKRPTVLLTIAEDGRASGSARSTEFVNITLALSATSKLLLSYGGHAAAAGMSLEAAEVAAFRNQLAKAIGDQIPAGAKPPPLQLDGKLSWSEIDENLVADLDRLAPFGAGNPQPILYASGLSVKSSRLLGRARRHRRLVVSDPGGYALSVLWWRGAGIELPPEPLDLAFTVGINTFRDQREVQLTLIGIRSSDPEAVPDIPVQIDVLDYRRSNQALSRLEKLSSEAHDVVIWSENADDGAIEGLTRDRLTTGSTLALWTMPPSPSELERAIQLVNPEKIVLFRHHARTLSARELLQHLAGLLKHVVQKKDGRTNKRALAAQVGEREATIDCVLDWMNDRGHFEVTRGRDGKLTIRAGNPDNAKSSSESADRLAQEMRETQAYRDFFARAELSRLFPDARQNE